MTSTRAAHFVGSRQGFFEWALGLTSLGVLYWLVGTGRVPPLTLAALEVFLAF